MAHFTAAQEQRAACIVCPHRCYRGELHKPCSKQDNSCNVRHLNELRRSKKYRKDILAICHWLYDDDLHYFKIKE